MEKLKKFWFGTWIGLIMFGFLIGVGFILMLGELPAFHENKISKVLLGKYKITVYHAVTAECDSTPDYGANGRVAINGVPTGKWFANNQMPFGTKILIPSVTGNTVWTCKDRLNHRYTNVAIIDLLMPKGGKAFGVRRADVYIIKEETLR